MRSTSSLLAALSVLVVAACDGAASDKGDESPLPAAGAADSLGRTTEHGPLAFDAPNEAELDGQQVAHAWEFTLGAAANVDLRIDPRSTDDLDTVLYLLRGTDGGWGESVARNDDLEGHPWSALHVALEAGEYRVLVKGYRPTVRGKFALVAGCSGAGCPSALADCDPSTFAKLPRDTGAGDGCVAKLQAVLTATPVVVETIEVRRADRCRQSPTVKLAWDYYRELMRSTVGKQRDPRLTLVVTRFGAAGARIEVTGEGEESRVAFLFDAADRLLALAHDAPSSEPRWFCRASNEKRLAEFPDGCALTYLDAFPASTAPSLESWETTTVVEAGTLPPMLAHAVRHYAKRYGLFGEAAVRYGYTRWATHAPRGVAYDVEVSGSGQPALTYLLVGVESAQYSTYLLHVTAPGGETRFLCEEV